MEIRKPIVTFAGSETQLPLQLKESIERELPQEALEWQRPYRRQPKTVYLEAKFEHYTDNFSSSNQLLEKQLLHTYWIECYDVDSYKAHYKENLINWVNKFSKLNSSEWLIVLIDHTDKKLGKSKLLPRSSVADKIKADFPFIGKSATLDRHIVTLTDAFKKDTRAIDSFLQFLNKVRLLLLSAYSKQLTSYEDYIRSQREQRNNDNWDFLTFFLAQEELAFAFELLGLYDEALVQYDELDALFSQFIQNATVDSLPFWLKNLIDKCDSWHGLFLSNQVSFQLRAKLKENKGSFLELRNYLFARQCELLLLQHMPWQVANRSLPFLQNCVAELKLLEIQLIPGAVDCWVFLSASEILLICERYNDSSQMDSYSKNTIDVRAYSRRKLEELGRICGLVPGMQSKSDHLHYVVSLIAGMGEDHHTDASSPSAQSRLKDALSGADAFLRNFLEFSELTMGTYKHIGRMREARLIGKELAEIYIKLGKYQLALSFLLDLEKVFLAEKWLVLLSNIRKEILKCYEQLNDSARQIVYCFYLASSLDLPDNEREFYFEKLQRLIAHSTATDEPIKIRMDSVFDVQSLRMTSQNKDFITNFDINLAIQLNSNLIRPLDCRRLYFNLQFTADNQSGNVERRRELLNEIQNNELCTELRREGLLERPTFDAVLEASSVGIACKNVQRVLKRFDSQFAGKDALINENELKFHSTGAEPTVLRPGPNELDLNFNTQHRGTYTLDLLCLFIEPNIYFFNNEIRQYSFDVISQQPSLELQIANDHLDCLTDELIAGIPQQIRLAIHSGSNYFPKATRFSFRSSNGLFIRLLDSSNDSSNHDSNESSNESSNDLDDLRRLRIDSNEVLDYELPLELRPFESYVFRLAVLCEFGEQRTSELITKKLELLMNDSDLKLNCPLLHFSPPFYSTMTLHTCGMTKFVQISLTSNSLLKFNLDSPKLDCVLGAGDDCEELNTDGESNEPSEQPKSGGQLKCKYLSNIRNCSIQNEKILHLMWEVLLDKANSGDFKLRFGLNYDLDLTNFKRRSNGGEVISQNGLNGLNDDLVASSTSSQFSCSFLLKEFTTLYTVRISVSPQTNSEFIKAGNLCLLCVKIKRNLGVEPEKSALMYELVSDKTVWAVNGKTAGVLENVEEEEYDLNFEVLPLISGFIPLPGIRLSKYIKQDQAAADTAKVPGNLQNASVKLVAFNSGQVYNYSRGLQVNVLQSSGIILND